MGYETPEGSSKTKEKTRGPKDIILNPVKQLRRLFGPREPTKDHSRKLAEAARNPSASEARAPGKGSDPGSISTSPTPLQPASGVLSQVAHHAPEGETRAMSSAAPGCLGGGVVRPAVARKAAEPGFGEDATIYEREADQLRSTIERGSDAVRAEASQGSSISNAAGSREDTRQARSTGGRDPMKEALAFYEREADMLKQRVLASRQVFS